MAKDELLWRYFRDINAAVEAGYRGKTSQPYRSGTFMVTALEGEMELTIKDISEEDAILIASELQDLGIKAIMTGSLICSKCGKRVPDQDYCISCRTKLTRAAPGKASPKSK
jgi:rRNA maturation endonuclease Nob1